MSFAIGSLVKARGREWVVLPGSDESLLVVRPLGGIAEETTGIHLGLEAVESAQFALPDPTQIGDYRSARLLRDAVRLGFRNSAGPFRSFARLAVEPRPYQLVPLLMGLKLDPVRLLIADDVGIGKTVEAGLIARELLDRGEIERLAVLCPPQLAEQWQEELREKFHIDAKLVLPSTVSRLERHTALGESLFDVYPHVIVSIDFIKSDRRRHEFIRTCPELVIVDEAHTCAFGGTGTSRHQRHELITGLAADPKRHILLVTATPHSGKEDAFRSLLTFLDKEFDNLPEDLSGPQNEKKRRWLAEHFIQRRRVDIQSYLGADTHFPKRADAELSYKLSADYKRLFDRVLEYARETGKDQSGDRFRQRVRWWSALALLRSMASSPAAAAATLRARAATIDAETPESADDIGKRTIFDLSDTDAIDGVDIIPGSDDSELEEGEKQESTHRRLLAMAREADKLVGKEDAKLQEAIKITKELLKDGFRPIIFCRFIPTAEYLAEQLRDATRGVEVAAITGLLPPTERELRIQQLAEAKTYVLVATDCLSEGINLQEGFDAVVHYDLSWNPTRHEQREGRVDRFGQRRDEVRVITYYGTDNQIDGVVLDVLLRKHRAIRNSLGISVPVPVNTDDVVEAIFEGLLLREGSGGVIENYLPGFEEFMKPKKEELYGAWETATERESRSRTMFAQESIKVEEVSRELAAAREAVGLGVDIADFFKQSLEAEKAVVSGDDPIKIDIRETPRALRDLLNLDKETFEATFTMPVRDRELYLTRTHPLVENLATYVMDTALDGAESSVAKRAGAIRTKQVDIRTTLLLLRLRYHLITKRGEEEYPLLAEEVLPLAFTGAPDAAEWLPIEEAEALLKAVPDANIHPQQATQFVQRVNDGIGALQPYLEGVAKSRAEELLQSHRRVRDAAKHTGRYRVEPKLPVDILGIYVYLPKV